MSLVSEVTTMIMGMTSLAQEFALFLWEYQQGTRHQIALKAPNLQTSICVRGCNCKDATRCIQVCHACMLA